MRKTCPRCLLPILPEAEAGRSTSLIFASLHCLCNSDVAGRGDRDDNAIDICLRCNKRIEKDGRAGSFTSFLFSGMRCRCESPDSSNRCARNHTRALLTQRDRSRQKKQRAWKTTRIEQHKHTHNLMSNASTRAMLDLASGDIIGGSFRLGELIGQGGMGSVFRAEHLMLKRQCALKFLMPHMVSESSWQMFKTEAQILNALNHPGMCKLFDLGIHQNALPFLAMEYIAGITLDDLIYRQGCLSTGAALEIFEAVAGALAYAHRNGIIHKDIKPGNIMLAALPNQSTSVKVLDFGISELGMGTQQNATIRTRERQAPTEQSDIIGSASYMSPEQFRGEPLTQASDIYSMGCALYETLTGSPPFVADTPDTDVVSDLSEMHQNEEPPTLFKRTGTRFPAQVEAIVAACLAKDPMHRYKTMSEFLIDIGRYNAGKPLQFARLAEPDEEDDAVSANPRNQWAIVKMAMAMAALALLISGTVFYMMKKEPETAPQSAGASSAGKPVSTDKAPQAVQPYRQKEIEEDSKGQYYVYNFPQESIGFLYSHTSEDAYAQACDARGRVRVPRQMYGFAPSLKNLSRPEILQRFLPDDLYSLDLTYVSHNMGAFLDAGRHLKNICQVTIEGDYSPADLNKLDYFPITNIAVMGPTASGERLAQWKGLANIDSIFYSQPKNEVPLLKKLIESKKLKYLALRGEYKNEFALDPRTPELVAQLTGINELNMENTSLKDDDVKILARLPELKALYLGGCNLTDACVPTILAMPKLELLEMNIARLTSANQKALKTKIHTIVNATWHNTVDNSINSDSYGMLELYESPKTPHKTKTNALK
ncbi:MAG: serine/threonine protein kinase [Candidatus Obscuribacterales bacterium]|nr:serine/threonine protein kinase [Candidatus Obscuribacterales bacterium]